MVASNNDESGKEAPLIIGKLGAPFGTQGWIKVNSFTEPQENIFQYKPWQFYVNGRWAVIPIKASRVHANPLIIQLENCLTPDAARLYTGVKIGVDATALLPLPQGEYYWSQLMGLQVFTPTGIPLGTVDHLMETGSNDVLVVIGDKTHCIPYLVNQVVLEVDLAANKMIVDWDPEF